MPGRFLGGTFEIYKGDREGEFRFRLRTSSGSIIVESCDSYTSRDAAERVIQLAAGIASHAKVVDLTTDG
jgi:uncharacterized protein YegP (UPF0339 family)